MGMEADGDPFIISDAEFPRDSCRTDESLSCQIFGDMNPPYDFGPMLSSDNLNTEPSSDSLLNEGLEGGYAPYDPSQPESSYCDNGAIEARVPTSSQNNQYQHQNSIDNLSGLNTIYSPSASGNALLNTKPGYNLNHPLQTYTPFTARIPSSLRNEYLPGDPYGVSSSMMAGYDHENYISSSPWRHKSNTRSGQLEFRNLQSLHQNDLQLSLTQPQNNNTSQQAIFDPGSLLNQRQLLQSIYNDQQQHTHHPSGQLNYGLAQQRPQDDERHTPSAQPCTPPSRRTSLHVDSSVSVMSMSSPQGVGIKREESASGSPLAKKRPRKGTRRKAKEPHVISDDDDQFITKSDSVYVKELVNAMNEGAEAEDNPGMQNTWRKIQENKADKVREKCVEMLSLLKRAQHEQLVDKKAVNPYPNFDHRFDETCAALRTQKTVCKHLMEAPYSHIVANDPTYAAQRVRNNRRVNGQKRQAITMGRQALGLQGQGKGKSMKKIEPVPFNDLYDDEDSGDDFDADEEDPMEAPIRVVKVESSSRKKAKKARKSGPDDDYEDSVDYSPPQKKAKRDRRSTNKVIADVQSVGNARSSTKSSARSTEHASATSSPPSQPLEPMRPYRGAQESGYYTTGNSYDAMAPSLPSLPQELYDINYQHGSHFNPFAYHSLGFGDFDHLDNDNGSNDTNASGPAI